MKCLEQLDCSVLDELDFIEALPVLQEPTYYAFPETVTASETTCTVTVTVAGPETYNGEFCYAQSPFGLCEKKTREVAIGWRGAAVLGLGAEVGVAFDSENNVGPILRFYFGTGVEVPITGLFPGASYTESEGTLYEQAGWGNAAKVQVFGGPSVDLDRSAINGADVGAIGGGAYRTWTVAPVSPEEQRATQERFERDLRDLRTTEGQLRSIRRLSGGW